MTWILIAEDDDDLRIQLAEALEEHGYEVRTASDGAEVMEILDAAGEMPALLILDWLMPRVSGYAVLRVMRDETRTKTVPVIILSGMPVDEEELAGAEVEAVFIKPVAALLFFDAIVRAIKKGTRGGG